LGWPGGRPLGSAEFQTVERWHRLLSEFASLETVSAQMSRSEALSHLRRMAEQAIFQPETAAAPVQILGLLETAGLRFDHLWIAGLDDESWPAAPKPDPFLPLRLQRERGLPHASPERELAFAHMVTERLLSSAPDIVVSHALRDEDDRELAASPLIRRVPEIGAAVFGEDAPPSYAELIRRSSAMEALEDRRGPPLAGAAHQAGGTRIFQLQALCPFRAFAALRLGAEPLEQPVPGLSPADRGQLVHRALAHVWNELSTHARLVEASAQELAEVVRAGIERALAWLAERRDQDLPARFSAIEQRRLERLLLAWLENEKGRAPFAVVEVEGEHYADLGGIRVKVRVDRIDRLAEGGDVIIDYKTGRQTPAAWMGERPEEPQLPVYATAHAGPLAAILFGRVRTREIAFRGFAARAGLVPGAEERDPEALIAEWRPVLERLGADFRAGAAEVDPKSLKVCRTCSLMPLCRIHEAEVSASALDSAEEDDA
jgi:probable DNA repair protein